MVVAEAAGCQRPKACRDGPGDGPQLPSERRIRRRLTRCRDPRSGHRHEQRVVARDGPGDLRPAGPIQGRRDGVGRARQRAQDEQQAGLVDLEREIRQELAQAILPGRLGLDQPGRQGIRRQPVAGDLDQPEFCDVARDGRLGGPKAALTKGGGQLLLGADRALGDQVPDRALACCFMTSTTAMENVFIGAAFKVHEIRKRPLDALARYCSSRALECGRRQRSSSEPGMRSLCLR